MKLITLTSCSAAGKDSIFKKVVENTKAIPIISTTNRPMRKGEMQDREYHFIDEETAISKLDSEQFLEHRIYDVADGSKWIYGITRNEIDIKSDNIYIAIVDYEGLKQLEESLGKENIVSIYINCSSQERLRRSLEREGNMSDIQVKEVCRRLLDDENKVTPAFAHCNFVLRNEKEYDLDDCVKILTQLIKRLV